MITTLYAALLAILYLFLTAVVIRSRYRFKVGIGDGGNEILARRIRVHGNFIEYVPLALLLLFFVDDGGASPELAHLLGAMLLAGRILHAIGLSGSAYISSGRMLGMILTFAMMAICAVILIWRYVALALIGF